MDFTADSILHKEKINELVIATEATQTLKKLLQLPLVLLGNPSHHIWGLPRWC